MNTYPYLIGEHEPTKKQLWLAAFTSLLCHMQPRDALHAADEAVELCDARWEDPQWVRTWQYKHNFPIGHRFSSTSNPPALKAKKKKGKQQTAG